MRYIIAVVAALTLTSCGGGRATGTIGRACMDGGRSAASVALCSCIQEAADQTLSAGDQRRAARFFSDPQEAQDARTADDPPSEAFWGRYRSFTDRAELLCR